MNSFISAQVYISGSVAPANIKLRGYKAAAFTIYLIKASIESILFSITEAYNTIIHQAAFTHFRNLSDGDGTEHCASLFSRTIDLLEHDLRG